MTMVGRSIRREPAGDGHIDVFPALGVYVCAGLISGIAVASIVTMLGGSSSRNPLAQKALGAAIGAILGLFVGFSRAVWWPGQPLPARASGPAPPQLWDPWLDSGRDVDLAGSGTESVVAEGTESPIHGGSTCGFPAERARVRPRVISADTGEAILLDDEIGSIVQAGRCGLVRIIGGPGSGKTTALRHLATILPPWALVHVRLFDRPNDHAEIVALEDADCHFVISVGSRLPPGLDQITYRLASWSQDDLIEYLLLAHQDQCASVMARLKVSNDFGFLQGIPELWTIVLDQMARDESVSDVRTALRCELAAWFNEHPRAQVLTEDACLTALGQNTDLGLNLPSSALKLFRLIRHRPTSLLLAADRITAIAEHGQVESGLTRRLPRDLIQEAAHQIEGNSLAQQHLSDWLNGSGYCNAHPMAASLLHAAIPHWRPTPDCQPQLQGAYLDHAAWSGLNLAGVNLESADLGEADLTRANLKKANASRARFHRANLQEALLNSWVALGADLRGANLRSVQATRANFMQTDLSGACLIGANFWKARLQGASIEDADFTGANLEDAGLSGLKLRLARFDGARFGGAELRQCDLEGMELADADFHDADLRKALLTDSQMSGANFQGANLRNAGLAEVHWPGADLRDTDLRGASFHLGTTRSGLVGSPIACEGSRTGFYTDDYHDQDVKPAEEIRKANLRGADLRGARIDGVDFYLVDLRDAKYTPDQAKHLRHCRAILEDRVG